MDEIRSLRIDICRVWGFGEVYDNPAGLWVIDLDWGEGAECVCRSCKLTIARRSLHQHDGEEKIPFLKSSLSGNWLP